MSEWHPGIPAEYRNQIVTGDAHELARGLPDESVDLCFTDPVYERIEDYRWLAEECVRVLRPDSAALTFCGIEYLPETLEALKAGGLSYRWTLVAGKPQGFRSGRFFHKGFSNWQCCLWMEKGKSCPVLTISDLAFAKDGGRNNFHRAWAKNPIPFLHWIGRFVNPAAVVWDPFTGGGTVPAVCRKLGVQFVAFEIDDVQAGRARERVALIPPPMLLPEPIERLTLALEEVA
jgi:DNA modification methylase